MKTHKLITKAKHKSMSKNKSDCKYAILNARFPDGDYPKSAKPIKELVRLIHREEFICRFCMKHIPINQIRARRLRKQMDEVLSNIKFENTIVECDESLLGQAINSRHTTIE